MRKSLTAALALVLAFGLMAAPAFGNNGNGKGNAPERANTTETLGFHERAEAVNVTEVRAEVADPTKVNFDDQFIYYRVTYEEVTYENHLYREVNRLDGNFEFGAGTSSRFWYGVSGPDEDGIQHQVVHDGTVVQYFRTEEGWKHLTATFEDGRLLEINDKEPEGAYGDVIWTPSSGPNVGVEILSTFSTEQGRVVTFNSATEVRRSIDLECVEPEENNGRTELWLSGTDQDDNRVGMYVRGGDEPIFNSWANEDLTCGHRWSGESSFLEGYIFIDGYVSGL
jgi:hypothetical protein